MRGEGEGEEESERAKGAGMVRVVRVVVVMKVGDGSSRAVARVGCEGHADRSAHHTKSSEVSARWSVWKPRVKCTKPSASVSWPSSFMTRA